MIGTVTSFSTKKRYGFIKPEDGGTAIFVHISTVERAGMKTLTVGQRLVYEVSFDEGERSMVIIGPAP
ncbi:MAG: cold shock domain-containing protein [Alphaproteobacteria bacterium]|nr:cold shock domain-containing protein [Alphaproteobacteria bacterium]